jgi:hypothetical protein
VVVRVAVLTRQDLARARKRRRKRRLLLKMKVVGVAAKVAAAAEEAPAEEAVITAAAVAREVATTSPRLPSRSTTLSLGKVPWGEALTPVRPVSKPRVAAAVKTAEAIAETKAVEPKVMALKEALAVEAAVAKVAVGVVEETLTARRTASEEHLVQRKVSWIEGHTSAAGVWITPSM